MSGADEKHVPPTAAWRDRSAEFTQYSTKAGFVHRRSGRSLWVVDSHRVCMTDLTPNVHFESRLTLTVLVCYWCAQLNGSEGKSEASYEATVLFIHGLGGRSEQFHAQMEFVSSLQHAQKSPRKYRVVAIDLFGHGRSDKSNRTYQYHYAPPCASVHATDWHSLLALSL